MGRLPKLAALLACTACSGRPSVISPQPIPVPGEIVEVRIDHVVLGASGASTRAIGSPGAVSATPGTLFLANLDAVSAVTESTLGSDGSFSATVAGAPSQAFRLVATSGIYVSEAYDVTAGTTGAAQEVVTEACLAQAAPHVVLFGGTGATQSLQIQNACARQLEVSAVHMGSGSVFSIDPIATPAPIGIGDALPVAIHFTPQNNAIEADLAVFSLADGGRIAVTLIGGANSP